MTRHTELLNALPTLARERPAAKNGWPWPVLRVLGALAVLATGAVHLHLYGGLYSQVPTIGTLFVLNFVGATGLGLALLSPIEQFGRRYGGGLLLLATVGGILLAATSFVFLLISEHTPLFGFKEPGYDPTAIAASRAAEIAAVVFLGLFLVGRFRLNASMRRW